MSTGIWGDCSTTLKQQAADYTSIPKVIFRKYPLFYMEYTDINAQVGYYNVVSSVFNTDETLLVRAEAYAMKKEYAKAIADMQIWQDAYTTSKVHLTEEAINKFYGNVAYYTPTKPTVKKRTASGLHGRSRYTRKHDSFHSACTTDSNTSRRITMGETLNVTASQFIDVR